jgi:hypothetical protein
VARQAKVPNIDQPGQTRFATSSRHRSFEKLGVILVDLRPFGAKVACSK